MHLIIDGYNLIHAKQSLTLLSSTELQRERNRLIDQIHFYRQLRLCEVTIVFDGWQGGWTTEKRERNRGIELIFSKIGEKADEVIKRLAKEKGGGTIVITSDRDISKYAEKMGAAVIPSNQFLEKIEKSVLKMGKEFEEGVEDEIGNKVKKGPSRRPSKKEKRIRAALKKL